jgi:hypothetical protein
VSRRAVMTLLSTCGAIGLLVPMVASPANAVPQRPAMDATTWCATAGVHPPCIVSVSRDSVPILSDDTNWDVSVFGSRGADGEYLAQWSIGWTQAPGMYESMKPGEVDHVWSVTVDMGTHVPRVTDEYGDNITVTRDAHNDGTYDVTTTGNPVLQGVNADCNTSVSPAVCPFTASQNVTTFFGEIGDFQQWNDSSQWDDFYGMDSWTNVEVTYIPPQIIGDPAQIVEPLANSHELFGGGLFHGFYHIIIPNKFLVDMGVDDPTTLGTDGLAATIGAGSVSITPAATSTEVDATGITFSHRSLHVKRGIVTPTRVSKLHARRAATHRGHLSFHQARARGSRIVGYQARCEATHHLTRRVFGKHSPLLDRSLTAGVRYQCQVRAKSKAGYGHWSPKVTLARHVAH